jgi:hypothetical protein
VKSRPLPLLLAALALALGGAGCRSSNRAAAPRDAAPSPDSGAAPPRTVSCKPGERCPQVLYARQGQPFASLAVDDAHLYWAERNDEGLHLLKAPKEGGGAVTRLGWYGGRDLSAQAIVLDEDEVFWVRRDTLARVSKAGGDATSTQLPGGTGSEWVASLLIDSDSIWVAHFGCSPIVQVPRSAGEPRVHRVHAEQPFRFGTNTALADGGSRILCGNGPEIHTLVKSTGAVSRVVTDQYRVVAITPIGEDLYWLNDKYRNDGQRLMVLRGGAAAPQDLGFARSATSFIHHDRARNRLLWIAGKGDEVPIVSYDLASGEVASFLENQSVYGGNAQDDRYLYWGALSDIMRVEK